jgi:hypothetical protein
VENLQNRYQSGGKFTKFNQNIMKKGGKAPKELDKTVYHNR